MRYSLLLSTALMIPVASQALAADFSMYTHTNTPIELVSISPLSNQGIKLASICFLGVGDCDPNIGYGKGDDYSSDTTAQCLNEGFILNDCSSVQIVDGVCPYNPAYGLRCKCKPSLMTCPAGQVGVGEACSGQYASCKCDPALVSCASNQNGVGASCGGKYQSCTCKAEYQYTSSNCTSPRYVTGATCGGMSTGCLCPSGVSAGSYGCAEYYPSPCSSVCKRAYTDNCHNRTAVSTPYGCISNFDDCASKCQIAYPENCHNRFAVSVPNNGYCTGGYSDCGPKCAGWACKSGYKQSGNSCVLACVSGGSSSCAGPTSGCPSYQIQWSTCKDCSGTTHYICQNRENCIEKYGPGFYIKGQCPRGQTENLRMCGTMNTGQTCCFCQS